MHPLSREKRGTVEMLDKDRRLELPLEKRFFQKKLRKSFGGSKIVLTFASAFRKKAFLRRVL